MKRVTQQLGVLGALILYGCTSGTETTKSDVKPAAVSGDATAGTVTVSTTGIGLDAIAPIEVAEDGSQVIPLKISSTAVGSVRVDIMEYPKHGEIQVDETKMSVKYLPDKDFHGRDSFAVRVTDGTSASVARPVAVKVTPVDDAPRCLSQSFGAKTLSEIKSTIICQDIDSSNVNISVKTRPSKGSLTLVKSEFTYTLSAGQTEDDQFEVIATADGKVSDAAVIKILPGSVGHKPVADSRSIACTEDETCIAELSAASENKDDGLHFEITQNPSNGIASLDIVNGVVTYSPKENFNGADGFKYKVRSGNTWSDEAKIDIKVAPVNDRPVFILQNSESSFQFEEDTQQVISYQLSDVELGGSDLSVKIIEGAEPQKGKVTIDVENSRIVYEPEPNYHGNDQFQMHACETTSSPEFCSVPVLVSLKIQPVNDAPVASNASLEIIEDSSPDESLSSCSGEDLKLHASDVDLDELKFSVEELPGLKLTGSCLTYTPEKNFAGTKIVKYTATDPAGLSNSNTVTILVAGQEDPTEFVAESLSCSGNEDELISCEVKANDADGPVTYSLTSNFNNLWALIDLNFASSGRFDIVPPKDFNGSVELKIRASGAGESFADATLTIWVKPVYDKPYWTERPASIVSVASLSETVKLKFKAVSPDKLPISYSAQLLPDQMCTLSQFESNLELNLTFNCAKASQSIKVKVTASDGTSAGVISENAEISFNAAIPYEVGPYWTYVNNQWQETSSNKPFSLLSCIKFKRPAGATVMTFDFDISLSTGYLDTYQDGKLGIYWSGNQAKSGVQVYLSSYTQSIDLCHYRSSISSYVQRTPEIIIKSVKFQ